MRVFPHIIHDFWNHQLQNNLDKWRIRSWFYRSTTNCVVKSWYMFIRKIPNLFDFLPHKHNTYTATWGALVTMPRINAWCTPGRPPIRCGFPAGVVISYRELRLLAYVDLGDCLLDTSPHEEKWPEASVICLERSHITNSKIQRRMCCESKIVAGSKRRLLMKAGTQRFRRSKVEIALRKYDYQYASCPHMETRRSCA